VYIDDEWKEERDNLWMDPSAGLDAIIVEAKDEQVCE
jgi:hypothetical protein